MATEKVTEKCCDCGETGGQLTMGCFRVMVVPCCGDGGGSGGSGDTQANTSHGIKKWETPNELDEDGDPIPYTWTVPAGVTEIFVSAAAGGGGGGGGGKWITGTATNHLEVRTGGGGSGGMSVIKHILSVSPGDTIPIYVGAGGKGGVAGNKSTYGKQGTNGEDTVIGNLATPLLRLIGGNTAEAPTGSPSYGGKSPGPGGQIGQTSLYAASPTTLDFASIMGDGGNTLLGYGGSAYAYEADSPAGYYGGGGAGGYARYSNNSFRNGSNGGDGVVIIEW